MASKNSLVEYLTIKINMEKEEGRKAIISQADSRDVYGLQVADFVANTIYQRLGGRNVELVERLNRGGRVCINKFPQRGFGEGDEVWYNGGGA